MRRVRYNRGSIDSTMRAAQKVVAGTNEVRFVFGTAMGFTIEAQAPAFERRAYRVAADGVTQVGSK